MDLIIRVHPFSSVVVFIYLHDELICENKMASERIGKVGLIAATSCISSIMTIAVIYAVFRFTTLPPRPPALASPKTATVILYPCEQTGCPGSPPVEIPPSEFERLMKMITPDKYYEGGMHDFILPIAAMITLTHEDGTTTTMMVRSSGVNPALVSVDGRNYFYATYVPHTTKYDGANELVNLVRSTGERKKQLQMERTPSE